LAVDFGGEEDIVLLILSKDVFMFSMTVGTTALHFVSSGFLSKLLGEGSRTVEGTGTVSAGSFILRVYLRLGFGTGTVESVSTGGLILRVYLRLGF